MINLKSGYPYWLVQDGLPYDYPKLTNDVKADVVIIGGGITGALCAYYLAKKGVDHLVVDARTIGLGSTCASTSLLQYELDKPLCELGELIGHRQAERAYLLCGNAIDGLERISRSVGYKGFEKHKSLYYAAYQKDVSLLKKEWKARNESGFEVRILEEKEIHQEYGFKAPLALLSEKGACVDAYLLAHKIHQANCLSGYKVYDRTTVKTTQYHRRGVRLLTEEGINIRAKKVINASGYEVKDFIQKKIVQLHSTYALASEHIPGEGALWKDQAMIWNTADPYLYMRVAAGRRIILGGRDEPFYDPIARDKLLGKKIKQLTADFRKLFPQLGMIPEFSWTGTFGMTKDALPFIGRYDKVPHTYFALGFGGNGITFSAIAAKIICDEIMGIRNKDASLFRFDRV